METMTFSDILALIIAGAIQILIGVALIKAGQKYYRKSNVEQSRKVFWRIVGVIISIWGWLFLLWAAVYTVRQILQSV